MPHFGHFLCPGEIDPYEEFRSFVIALHLKGWRTICLWLGIGMHILGIVKACGQMQCTQGALRLCSPAEAAIRPQVNLSWWRELHCSLSSDV